MSKPIITKQMLIDAGTRPNQVDLFEKTFGDSVVVTVEQAKKVAHLFDWGLAVQLLDGQGRAEYWRDAAIAWAEYQRVREAAWAEYRRVTSLARAEYKRVTSAAQVEYERVAEPARVEYERVQAPAWAEYQRVAEPARAEYKRATATAWATAFINMHKRGASHES